MSRVILLIVGIRLSRVLHFLRPIFVSVAAATAPIFGMFKRVAFLDTSIFMHCKPPDHIDWLTLLDTKEAVLIVEDVVAGELNEAKDRHSNLTLRYRARGRLTQLHEFWKESLCVEIRPNVTMQYAATNSHTACVLRGLDPTLMDDRLLACALLFRDSHADEDVVVVTQDAHFAFKARYHGLTILMPADDDVIEEIDPAEKENPNFGAKRSSYNRVSPGSGSVFPMTHPTRSSSLSRSRTKALMPF